MVFFQWNLPYVGSSINELIAVWKLLRTNQLKNSSWRQILHIETNWRSSDITGRLASSFPQTEAKAHCPNTTAAVTAWKGSPAVKLARIFQDSLWETLHQYAGALPVNTQSLSSRNSCQQRSWSKALSSKQCFPDVETQWWKIYFGRTRYLFIPADWRGCVAGALLDRN